MQLKNGVSPEVLFLSFNGRTPELKQTILRSFIVMNTNKYVEDDNRPDAFIPLNLPSSVT